METIMCCVRHKKGILDKVYFTKVAVEKRKMLYGDGNAAEKM